MDWPPRTPSIHGQLSTLLGREVKQLRKTGQVPPRVSVIDVISAFLGVSGNVAAVTLGRLKSEYPEVTSGCCDFKLKTEVVETNTLMQRRKKY